MNNLDVSIAVVGVALAIAYAYSRWADAVSISMGACRYWLSRTQRDGDLVFTTEASGPDPVIVDQLCVNRRVAAQDERGQEDND